MKRTVFRNRWLPYALVAPQLAVTLVFFFWPAFDSLRLSLYRASPFGDRLIFIGLGNFVSVRDAIEEQMENIFSGSKTAKQGLDDAVAKGNDILKEFAALYR